MIIRISNWTDTFRSVSRDVSINRSPATPASVSFYLGLPKHLHDVLFISIFDWHGIISIFHRSPFYCHQFSQQLRIIFSLQSFTAKQCENTFHEIHFHTFSTVLFTLKHTFSNSSIYHFCTRIVLSRWSWMDGSGWMVNGWLTPQRDFPIL